jgi:hypothetical protein
MDAVEEKSDVISLVGQRPGLAAPDSGARLTVGNINALTIQNHETITDLRKLPFNVQMRLFLSVAKGSQLTTLIPKHSPNYYIHERRSASRRDSGEYISIFTIIGATARQNTNLPQLNLLNICQRVL